MHCNNQNTITHLFNPGKLCEGSKKRWIKASKKIVIAVKMYYFEERGRERRGKEERKQEWQEYNLITQRPWFLFTSNAKRPRPPEHPCCAEWKAWTNQRHSSSVFIFLHNEKPSFCMALTLPFFMVVLKIWTPSMSMQQLTIWQNYRCLLYYRFLVLVQ